MVEEAHSVPLKGRDDGSPGRADAADGDPQLASLDGKREHDHHGCCCYCETVSASGGAATTSIATTTGKRVPMAKTMKSHAAFTSAGPR